jgi:tRNA(Ile)-lysidine synthase
MDSMALIDVLIRLGYHCIAAHCNFHLRGAESDRDARFVKEWCEDAGIPLISVDFNTRRHAADNKLSIEMAARELRYDWFEAVRREQEAEAVAVAHHRDDSVETVLLNLIRGTGIKGMSGIAARNRHVIRPLLPVSRSEIEEYVAKRNIPHVVDSTNQEDIYVRNAIRLNIIPALEAINPKVKEAIHRTSLHLAEAEKVYDRSIRESIDTLFRGNRIDIRRLRETASPRAVLFEILSPLGFDPSTIRAVYRSMEGEPGRQFHARSYRLIKDREFFILDQPGEGLPEPAEYLVDEGVSEIRSPLRLTLRVENMPVEIRKERRYLYMDADKVAFPLLLRKWRQGDWFIPFGMKGRKKLSDFFTDIKLSIKEKEEAWVLLSGNDIAWVVGERADDRFRVTGETKRVLVVEQAANG